MIQSTKILPTIVVAQFFCTSLWFASNGVMDDIVVAYGLQDNALAHLTSAVQFGFICGTLIFAILTLSDRFSPSKVFLCSALLASLFNIAMIWHGHNLWSILSLRFLVGFFLAGIYPVGMKIASDYYQKGLGKSLGFLVGALVLGTALPHGLRDLTDALPWKSVIISVSTLATIGGLSMVVLVPDGPCRKVGQKANWADLSKVFRDRDFRSAAFGYFGHMWELYAFWAFVPLMLKTYNSFFPLANINVPLFSFLIIGIGGLSCIIGGYISQVIGLRKTATLALFLSCLCCLSSPFFFHLEFKSLFLIYMFFWGMVVIADSPLFSTLVAHHAPPYLRGTALTLVTCIGFSVTIISIQLLSTIIKVSDTYYVYALLSIGPIIALYALWKNR